MTVRIRLLDGFAVTVDGVPVPAPTWRRRPAGALVKLLALSPESRLHRDRVVDALWPDVTLDLALPRLHKAAHYARTALGHRDAVVLKGEVVAFFPGITVEVDALAFETAADLALASDPPSPAACADALKLAGELLPEDLAESWLEEPRERLRLRVTQLLRGAHRWEDLLRLDLANEEAHLELLREAVLAGDRTTALRRYARMREALESELGITPSPEAVVLRDRALAAVSSPDEVVELSAELVERDEELAALSTAIRSVVEERRGVVALVSGEAGAGKSALVRAFVGGLDQRIAVALGGCDDLLAPRSLGPFRDMAAVDPQIAEALDRPEDALPGLLRVFAARPSVVVVEDVHWADDATLDAIRFLARRVPGIPAALVLTFRETGTDPAHPLRQLLGTLTGPAVRRVTLPPLSVDAVRRLGATSSAQAVEIQRVTQGNPFFVTEVLAAGGTGVPHTVRDAVLARLGTLSVPARTVVERLSVIPTRAERWLAETLASGDADLLVEAERSGMLVGGESTVAFRHELARQAIESALTAGERVQANRVVVDALLGHPEVEPSRLVHHADRCGRTDVILAQGPAAAREAARLGAHRQAAEILDVVLRHHDLLEPAEAADLYTRRAYSLYLVNQYEAALDCAQSAVTAAEGDAVLQADALIVLSRVALFARGPLFARWASARAVDLLDSGGDDARLAAALTEVARAHGNLATVGGVAEPSELAEQYAERALTIAEALQRKELEAQALCYVGDARLARGDARGEADLRRAITLAASDSRAENRVRCYVNAAGGAHRTGRLDDAQRYVAAGLRAAADGEFFAGQYRLRLTAAAVQACRGEWDQAITGLRELLASPGEPGLMAALARSVLARLLARRGDPAAADVLAPALADPIGADDTYIAGPLAIAQVELGWLDGSLGDLTDEAQRALDLAAATGHRSIQAELAVYLQRAGLDVPGPTDPPGPWAPTLAGRWREAVAAWAAHGDEYEQAVVLARAPTSAARAEGHRRLAALGAVATLPAV
ncbi:DNA-binding SARP family transcriptional activator [Kribbella amoyensis]|uniref:DNA-binding SARP family transcriptional activator n=1 Tax=Kribbella amoyensis TaxID=996641 RepID=A0A561BTG3_9ACTN|nr:AAA family ATPase [Kribbella amoyensis]TWD82174.1 DNA-binding SARP family transcriptional activator [Kribbella amoyensis]